MIMRFTQDDERSMRLSLGQAQLALEEGEIPVGCAVVSEEGEVLALTRNRVEATGDLTAHAEMLAIRQIRRCRLKNAVLYVTLEPCPMCAGAIALSGMKRVIYAAADRKYGCCGSVYRITEDPAFDRFCQADGGLLREESEALLKEGFRRIREK